MEGAQHHTVVSVGARIPGDRRRGWLGWLPGSRPAPQKKELLKAAPGLLLGPGVCRALGAGRWNISLPIDSLWGSRVENGWRGLETLTGAWLGPTLKLPNPSGPGLTLRRQKLQKQALQGKSKADASASFQGCLGTQAWETQETVHASKREDGCVCPCVWWEACGRSQQGAALGAHTGVCGS